MTEKDYIGSCRYYGGEETAPEGKGTMLWNVERAWVRMSVEGSDALGSILDGYLDAGLRTFCQYDDTPATLKAVLFNVFAKYNSGGPQDAAREFRKFYLEQYMKG